ncbi:MAG: hypothetical protein KC489_05630, partial [Gemmatimonadetes bacterium]|nr:hypothetical protein [Gemmatimonadota bacterium]
MTISPDLRAREFAALDAAGIYLNSASIGPMPRRALDVLHAANADRAAPIDWPMSRLDGILGGARERAARLVGTDPATIALMPNTTTGINVAAQALGQVPRAEVRTLGQRVDLDGRRCITIKKHRGVVLERIP